MSWGWPIWRSWNAGPTRGRCWPPGPARLTALIAAASHGQLGAERAQQWRAAAAAAVELYADHPAIAWTDLAAEVGTEVRLLRATQAELATHAQERETAYRYTDLGGLARSLPGVAEVSGPILVAGMGRPARLLNTFVGAFDRGVVVSGVADAGCALGWFVGVTTAPTKRDAQVGRSAARDRRALAGPRVWSATS